MMRIEPRELSYKAFPASEATAVGMKVLPMNPDAVYARCCTIIPIARETAGPCICI